MKLLKKHIKVIQNQLNKLGYNSEIEDGIFGNKTKAALNHIDELPIEWDNERRAIGFIQFACKKNFINAGKIDGYWGPQTEYAFETLSEFITSGHLPALWRDIIPLNVNPNKWPSSAEADIVNFYGAVNKNQKRFVLPYSHRLSWNKDTIIDSIYCNEKIHESLNRVLTNVLNYYGLEEIRRLRLDLYGGCLNVRKMRGGSKWSTHSWGIAIDYDPDNNKLKWGSDKASFSKAEYSKWWRFWEEEGWTSLGRTKNYDWMHIQATSC
jgi:hypothetical protein